MKRRGLLAFLLAALVMSSLVGVPVPASAQAQALWPASGLATAPLPSPECSDGANTLYVDDVASGGDGSFGSPFNNVQSALDAVRPGNTIYLLPGTYDVDLRLRTQSDGAGGARICLRAYDPGDRPVIRRASGFGGSLITLRHPYYVLDGLVFDGQFAPESDSSLVQIAHYGSGDEGENGDYAILRNCEVKDNLRNGVSVAADHVLIENCEIHHHLRGSMASPRDAHGILGTHETDLTVRYCDIHHVSGDALQTDPDIYNAAGTKLWDQVLVEHSRLWTGPLAQAGGEWNAGDNPGENAIDTKTFEDGVLTHRPQITIRNVEAFGFSNTSNARRSAFNVKYNVDFLIDGVTTYDNEIAFRVRGPWDNPSGGARATIQNVVAYDNDLVFRFERDIEQLHIYHGTFADNVTFGYHADCPESPCYDEATFELFNSLFLGTKPDEAFDPSNLSGDDAYVRDAAGRDYRLPLGSPAIDAGVALAQVTTDLVGVARPQGGACDVGAHEFLPSLILHGRPGDRAIHLTWDVNATLPATTTWLIEYEYPSTFTAPFTATDPLSTTRAYTLTELTNYRWYTVTLTAVGTSPLLSDSVRVMPTGIFVYLPLLVKGD